MAVNKRANLLTDFDEQAGEPYEVLPEKPKPTKVLFYPLPEYSQDRRYDPRARDNEHIFNIPYKDGYLEDFNQIAEPGFYFVEFRAGNKINGSGYVHEVGATGRMIEHAPATSAASPPSTPEQVASQERAPAQAVNNVADTVRAVRELTRELSPPATKADSLTRDDVQAVVRDTLAEVLAHLKPAPHAEAVDPLAMVERVVELQKKLAPPVTAQPAPAADIFEQVMNMFDRVEQLRARVEPPASIDDETSTLGKISGLVDVLGRNADRILPILAPLLPARIQSLLSGIDAGDITAAGPAPAEAQPAQRAGPANEQEALQLILHVGVADLVRNKRVGRTADLAEELCRRFPSLNQTVDELMQLEPEVALATLEQISGRSDLIGLGHGLAWIEALQDELRSDDEESEDGSEPPSILEMAEARAS